ncbi:Uncharacterized protein QTN25_009939 [Entamoeba marina]
MPCFCPDVDGQAAYPFFEDHFHTCMYSPIDVISYICGLINIGFWILAQVPQIWKLYRTKKPESLSITFLVMWLGGDFTNLIGCIFTNQTQTQLLTSIYFVLMDVIMLWQYAWYLIICRKKYHSPYVDGNYNSIDSPTNKESEFEISTPNGNNFEVDSNTEQEIDIYDQNTSGIDNEEIEESTIINHNSTHFLPIFFLIICISFAHHLINEKKEENGVPCDETETTLTVRIIGDVSAWISGLLYFSGRVPQIIHNFRFKNVEGMSISLFIMSTIANVFYSLSIFLDGIDVTDPTFYEAKLAYIVGSTLVIPFSLIVIYQYYHYTYISKLLVAWRQKRAEVATME